MKFRPRRDRVVVRRAEGELKSKGIIVPDTAKKKPQEGAVIAIGPVPATKAASWFPLDVKAGDLILLGCSGTEVRIDGEDLLIMKAADIMGIVTKTKTPPRKAA